MIELRTAATILFYRGIAGGEQRLMIQIISLLVDPEKSMSLGMAQRNTFARPRRRSPRRSASRDDINQWELYRPLFPTNHQQRNIIKLTRSSNVTIEGDKDGGEGLRWFLARPFEQFAEVLSTKQLPFYVLGIGNPIGI